MIGTAFDYLLRWHIQAVNKNVQTKPWVGESAVYSMMAYNGGVTKWLSDKDLRRVVKKYGILETSDTMNDEKFKLDEQTITDAYAKFLEISKVHETFLKKKNLTDDVLESIIHLAQFDPYYRAGVYILSPPTKDDLEDLRNLYGIATESNYFNGKDYKLNPTFDDASQLISGADADLIMDDILIDIKTTKKIEFSRAHYNQLIGYYSLNALSSNPISINKVAIYFSRHGILHIIDVSEFEDKMDKFLPWFAEACASAFPMPEISSVTVIKN